jgi:hypothetical protein
MDATPALSSHICEQYFLPAGAGQLQGGWAHRVDSDMMASMGLSGRTFRFAAALSNQFWL